MCLLMGTVSQVSDVAHGPLVFKIPMFLHAYKFIDLCCDFFSFVYVNYVTILMAHLSFLCERLTKTGFIGENRYTCTCTVYKWNHSNYRVQRFGWNTAAKVQMGTLFLWSESGIVGKVCQM